MTDSFWNSVTAFMLGAGFALFILIFVLVPFSPKWANEKNIIVSKNGKVLTCHIKKEFPETNCELVAKAIGPYGQKDKTLIIKDDK